MFKEIGIFVKENSAESTNNSALDSMISCILSCESNLYIDESNLPYIFVNNSLCSSLSLPPKTARTIVPLTGLPLTLNPVGGTAKTNPPSL